MDMKYISFVMSNCDVVTFPLVYIWSGQESVMDGLADGGGLKNCIKPHGSTRNANSFVELQNSYFTV